MVAHSYADQLFERHYDVVAFVPFSKKYTDSNKKYPVEKVFPLLRLGNAAFLPQLVWKLWKFDILHLHYPFFGASFFVLFVRLLRGKKTKLITNYHMDVSLPGIRGLYVKLAHRLFLPALLKYSDKIIVSSIDYVENSDIQAFYFKNKHKFLELPFGVPRRYSPTDKDADLLQKYNIGKNEPVVLFVGSLDSAHYFKGVDYLIRALPLVNDKNVKILIVGAGNLRPDFEKLATELQVAARVIFAGYVRDEDLPKHYNLADFFCLASTDKSEAFGIVLLEAMACGKPLIASNLKGVRAVVDQGINGLLVEPKNSIDIANKINYLVENPSIARSFGERGVASVEEKYRWSKIVTKLVDVYKKLSPGKF